MLDYLVCNVRDKVSDGEHFTVVKSSGTTGALIPSVKLAIDKYLNSPGRPRLRSRAQYRSIERPEIHVDERNRLVEVDVGFGLGFQVQVDSTSFGEVVLVLLNGEKRVMIDMDRFPQWLANQQRSDLVWSVDAIIEVVEELSKQIGSQHE